MKNKIIERYKNLHEECKKYPRIHLSGVHGEKPKIYEESNNYAKDGFIEVFCMEKEKLNNE